MSTAAEREAERKQAARVKRAEKRAQREAEARARNNAASRVRRRADAELAKAQALTTEQLVDPLVHAAKVAAYHAATPEPAIERPCINLVRHKVRRMNLVREDGSKREVEIDVGSMPERIAVKRLTEQLGDNLPTCACCGEKVAPADRNPRFKKVVICTNCPSCACGARLVPQTMLGDKPTRRAGRRPCCRPCLLKTKRSAALPRCKDCDKVVKVSRGKRRKLPPYQCRQCRIANAKGRDPKCAWCAAPVGKSTLLSAVRGGRHPQCLSCWRAQRHPEDEARSHRKLRSMTDEEAIETLRRMAAGATATELAASSSHSRPFLSALRSGLSYRHLDAFRPWKTEDT